MAITGSSPIAELKLPADVLSDLTRAGLKNVAHLTGHSRAHFQASTSLRSLLPALDKAFAKHGLAFTPDNGFVDVCATCPKCGMCGNPRAQEPKQIATGLDGRLKHVGFQATPTCDDCHDHHRAVLGMLVDA